MNSQFFAADQFGTLAAIGAVLQKFASAIEAQVQKIAKAEPAVRAYLMDRGWLATCRYRCAMSPTVERLIASGQHEEIDTLMCGWVNEGAQDIQTRLCLTFPGRSLFFTEAFEAHAARKFTLSIPSMLAQADGVGCEILNVRRHFFKPKNRVDALGKTLNSYRVFGAPYPLQGVWKKLLEPLGAELSVAVDTDERSKRQDSNPWFGPLNRHGVLHGLDVDYATAANSYRCINLLEFLLDVHEIVNEEIPKDAEEHRLESAGWAPLGVGGVSPN